MVEDVLRMYMKVESAKSRIELLFVEYKSLLPTDGLKRVAEKALRAATRHELSAIHPAQLRKPLKQDLGFSHIELKVNFSGFIKHAIAVSEAFKKVNNGPARSRKSEREGEKTKKNTADSSCVGTSSSKAGTKKEPRASSTNKRPPPAPCPLKK